MKRVVIILIIVLITMGISLYLINRERYIDVGVVADLSSSNSSMGISARNGVQIAIDELNASGGVKGHQFRLHIKNHGGDKDRSHEVARELIEEGVRVIIGPTLSGMADSVISATEGSDVLVIGATISADHLKERDDNFLRISSPSSRMGIGHYDIAVKRGSKKIALLIDDKNAAYGSGVLEGFKNSIIGDELEIVSELHYTSTDDFEEFIEEINTSGADSLILINSGVDGGKFIQMYNKKYPLPTLYGSGWNKVSQMEKHAGKLMEGMIFVDNYRSETPGEKELEFRKKYKEIFHIDANTVAMFYYEAMDWFALGVENAKSLKSEDIKQGILEVGNYSGLFEDYTIDQYGDGVRGVQNFMFRDGQYDYLKD